jgi:hypothetical protein
MKILNRSLILCLVSSAFSFSASALCINDCTVKKCKESASQTERCVKECKKCTDIQQARNALFSSQEQVHKASQKLDAFIAKNPALSELRVKFQEAEAEFNRWDERTEDTTRAADPDAYKAYDKAKATKEQIENAISEKESSLKRSDDYKKIASELRKAEKSYDALKKNNADLCLHECKKK